MFIKLDREYEVKCTLGTIKDIENRFGKPFYTLIGTLDKMNTSDQIRLLYLGVKRADPAVSEAQFTQSCEDNLGLGELTEYLEQFVLQLQYPGLTGEEVQQKIEKKLEATRKLQEARASIGAK